MAITHPLVWRQQIAGMKLETTNGTAIALSASDGPINFLGDVELDPDIPANERQSPGSMSPFASVPGASGAKVGFSVEMSNSGSATNPLWMTAGMAASGFNVSAGVATVQSGSTSAATVTFGHYLDGVFFSATGVMFDQEWTFESGKTIPMKFDGKGIWVAPSDVALIAPTYITAAPPKFQGATFTVAGLSPLVVPRMVIKLNNDVQLRENGGSTGGYVSSVIVNRNVTVEVDIEAALLATINPYSFAAAGTQGAMSCALGSGSNGTVTITAPKLQLRMPPKKVNKNGILYYNCLFGANKSADAGDDELVVTLT